MLHAVIMDVFAEALHDSEEDEDEDLFQESSSVSLPLSDKETDRGSLADTLPTANPLGQFTGGHKKSGTNIGSGQEHPSSNTQFQPKGGHPSRNKVSEAGSQPSSNRGKQASNPQVMSHGPAASDSGPAKSTHSPAQRPPTREMLGLSSDSNTSSEDEFSVSPLPKAGLGVPTHPTVKAPAALDPDSTSVLDSESDDGPTQQPANFYNRFLATSRAAPAPRAAISDGSDSDDLLHAISNVAQKPRQPTNVSPQPHTVPRSATLSENMSMYGVKDTDTDSEDM